MKEYIERAVALEILKRNPIGTWRGAPVYSEEIKSAADEIGDLPAAGVAEVVRCRDCKWFNHYTTECESDDVATDHEGGASFSLNFGPDDFCSYGQRKEADHEVSE